MKDGILQLYDAFGELLYVLAKSDGEIQVEEVETLHALIAGHNWSEEIIWSFEYESKKKQDLETVYNRVIDTCAAIGPHKEYELMLQVLEAVAESSLGIVKEERAIIDRFKTDLTSRFI
ncbi:MAG: hypothetical protein ACI959_001297 [Limisphaerales bacterium]|jgi:hypothetical protein